MPLAILLSAAMVTASPLAPEMRDEEAYSETWTVVLQLTGGTYIQVQLAVSNLGLGDKNAACRVLVVEGEDTWTANEYRELPDWGFRPPTRLEVGSCFIDGAESTRVHAEVGGGTVDVTLGAKMQAVAPPGHRIETEDGFFEQKILLRHASAKVFYRTPDNEERRARGFGTIDHFRVTALPSDLARRWVRLYSLTASGAFLLMARDPPDAAQPAIGWAWPAASSRPLPLGASSLHAVEGQWRLEARAGGATWTAVPAGHLFRYAPLEQFGFVGWVAGTLLGNPATHTFRVKLMGADGIASAAIMEVTANE